jgi:hypothetical protein
MGKMVTTTPDTVLEKVDGIRRPVERQRTELGRRWKGKRKAGSEKRSEVGRSVPDVV